MSKATLSRVGDLGPHPPRPPAAVRSTRKVRSRGSAAPVLDEQIFSSLQSAVPPSALAEIYNAFLSDTRRRAADAVATLERAAPTGVCADFAAPLHAIFGSAGMVGALGIAGFVLHLQAHPEAVSKLRFRDLLAACDQLESRLRAEGLPL